MQIKYIKVTEKDKTPFVVLASNEAFYKNRNATIEEPTKEEIENAFPEEAAKGAPKASGATNDTALAAEKTAHEETKKKLEAEILAHDETRKKLEDANAALSAKKEKPEPKAAPTKPTNENQTESV